jgi:hypothetical protein
METWQGFLAAASGGALVGGAVGLFPLAIGLLRRKTKVAASIFAVCVVAGAIGGIFAAIAGMAVGLAPLMRREKIEKSIEPQ